MTNSNVKNSIEQVIKEIAMQNNVNLPVLEDHLAIVDDLGFTSLRVAELIANLEDVFGIDPFQDENVSITNIRTLKDLCEIYTTYLEKTTAK